MENGKKKSKHIVLWILLALLIIIAGLLFWQRDNIKALFFGIEYSSGEITQKLEETESHLKEVIDAYDDAHIRDFTEEDAAGLKEGKVSHDKFTENIVDDIPEELSEEEKQYQYDLSLLIAEVYALRIEYSGKLEDMAEAGREEYGTLTDEQKEDSNITKWVAGYVKQTTVLEKECNAKMDDVLGRMLELINAHDGDTSIVDEIQMAYAEEKRMTKAWYLAQLKERGLMS